MATVDQIQVEVVYALPDETFRKSLSVPAGTTLKQAVELSGVQTKHPEIDLSITRPVSTASSETRIRSW